MALRCHIKFIKGFVSVTVSVVNATVAVVIMN